MRLAHLPPPASDKLLAVLRLVLFRINARIKLAALDQVQVAPDGFAVHVELTGEGGDIQMFCGLSEMIEH